VANGYKFSTKVEHHEILRKYVKSLKPLIRLSKPALETLAVIAYRQPATLPEIEEIRGVDSGGVIHTLLEKKLVVTAGRKSVVGRPILYRTSKDFLVHFGLKEVGELPSLKEFEELAKRALGSEWATGEGTPEAAPDEAAVAPGEPATVPGDTATTPEGTGATPVETPPETTLEASQPIAEEPPAPSVERVPASGGPVSAALASEPTLPAETANAQDITTERSAAEETAGDSSTSELSPPTAEATPHSTGETTSTGDSRTDAEELETKH
jgi:segregation and condensation protein B